MIRGLKVPGWAKIGAVLLAFIAAMLLWPSPREKGGSHDRGPQERFSRQTAQAVPPAAPEMTRRRHPYSFGDAEFCVSKGEPEHDAQGRVRYLDVHWDRPPSAGDYSMVYADGGLMCFQSAKGPNTIVLWLEDPAPTATVTQSETGTQSPASPDDTE